MLWAYGQPRVQGPERSPVWPERWCMDGGGGIAVQGKVREVGSDHAGFYGPC